MRRLPALAAAVTALVAVPAAVPAPEPAPPPTSLSDGRPAPVLPGTVRRHAGLPVVGARRLTTPVAGAASAACPRRPGEQRLAAWLSPDGLSLVRDHARLRGPRACDLVRVRSRWRRCSVGVAPTRDPRALERAGGALGVCTRDRTWRAFMWVRPSPRAAWALVRRRTYWVAYPVASAEPIRISGTERGTRRDRYATTVAFLDRRGALLERRRVVGVVAS